MDTAANCLLENPLRLGTSPFRGIIDTGRNLTLCKPFRVVPPAPARSGPLYITPGGWSLFQERPTAGRSHEAAGS